MTPAAYRNANRIVLAVGLCAAVGVVLQHGLARWTGDPVWLRCRSLVWFGVPCPLCGMTRGVLTALRGDWAGAAAWNPLAGAALALAASELAYRVPASLRVFTPRTSQRLARCDVALHALLGAVYILYALWFWLR